MPGPHRRQRPREELANARRHKNGGAVTIPGRKAGVTVRVLMVGWILFLPGSANQTGRRTCPPAAGAGVLMPRMGWREHSRLKERARQVPNTAWISAWHPDCFPGDRPRTNRIFKGRPRDRGGAGRSEMNLGHKEGDGPWQPA